MNTIRTKWEEFRQLFIAAHHNPIARRREDDEYSAECRRAFDELVDLIQADSSWLMNKPSPSDMVAAVTTQLVQDPDWLTKAVRTGQMIDVNDLPTYHGVIGNTAPSTPGAIKVSSPPRLRIIPE